MSPNSITKLYHPGAGDFEKGLQDRMGIPDRSLQNFDKIFPALSRLKGLKHLDLVHIAPMTGELWKPLATLEDLEYAGLNLAGIKTEVCPSITRLSKLFKIFKRQGTI